MCHEHTTILLVEDEAIIALNTVRILKDAGYSVTHVTAGESAVDAVHHRQADVDLILMDIDLGSGIDGIEAARQILRTHDIPVVFLSSHQEQDHLDRAEVVSPYGYVVKSSGTVVLLQAIRMAVRLHDATTRLARYEPAPPEEPPAELTQDATQDATQDTTQDTTEAVRTATPMNQFLQLAPDLMCTITADGTLEMVSDAWEQVLGITKAELRGSRIFDYVHPEDREKTERQLARVVEGETAHLFVNRYRTAHGEYRSLEWHATVDGEGLVYAAARDITEKLESERRRRKSERRYLLALENTDAGVWDWDLQADTVTFGARWKSMLGYHEREVEESLEGWRALWHPDDAPRIQQAMEDYQQGRTARYEIVHRLRHKDGSWRWILTRGGILYDDDGAPDRWIGTNVDVTEQKIREHELADEVARNELLMSELQHRVKNSLGIVSSLLSTAGYSVSDPTALRVLDDSRSRIHTIAEMYDQMHSHGEVSRVNLGPYLRDLIGTLSDTLGDDHQAIHLSTELSEITVDAKSAVSVGLVVNELITNVYKYAYPDSTGGTCHVSLDQDSHGQIRLVVSDDGVGSFTTEDRIGNTGSDLIAALVDQLDGEIHRSNDSGTTVVVSFPRAAAGRQRRSA
ncbi:MAG: PAS domain-containing protein [Alkalispirochaeta sp.]